MRAVDQKPEYHLEWPYRVTLQRLINLSGNTINPLVTVMTGLESVGTKKEMMVAYLTPMTKWGGHQQTSARIFQWVQTVHRHNTKGV